MEKALMKQKEGIVRKQIAVGREFKVKRTVIFKVGLNRRLTLRGFIF